MNKIKIWILATRAETIFISLSPIAIGSFLAYKETSINIPILILTFLYGIFLHLGTNLSNDYYDFLKGADNENRIAPLSTIQRNLTSLREVKFAFSLFFILAFLIGLIFIFRTGLITLLLFTLPIFAGYFYTGGTKALGYLGFGDILVFIFFGPFAVLGTYYLQTLKISYLPILAGFGPGFLSTAVLIINNLRDIELDKIVNKNTLAVKFGKKFTQLEFLFCIIFAFSIPWIFYFSLNKTFVLSSSLFIFFVPFKLIFKFENNFLLNKGIQKIAMLQIVYTVLFCLGMSL